MPDSISDNEKPHIWTYIGLFFFMLSSGLMTAFGYANSAWVVVVRIRQMDEFQVHKDRSNSIQKFAVFHVAYYIALIIIVNQMFWLCYAFKYCCQMNYCKSVKKYKLTMFSIMLLLVGFWVSLFGMIVYEVSAENILPVDATTANFKYQIGRGCWCFFGGMFPFIGAVYCFSHLTIKNQHLLVSLKESSSDTSSEEVSIQEANS